MRQFPIITVSALTVSNFLLAGQMDIAISGFADPQAFLDVSLDVRFAELAPSAGANSSTHILIEGLSPLTDGSVNYYSTYSGIDVSSGAIQDTGVIYMKMPQDNQPPAGTVVSPIVGVVQRQGDWSSTNPIQTTTDISNAVTGDTPTGLAQYDGTTLNLSLHNGSNNFSGTVNYAVLDSDTLLLDPFLLTRDDNATYSMAEAILIRDGDRFFGTLTNLEPTATYDSLIYSIDLDSIPDIDLDSIPDISDPLIYSQGAWSSSAIGLVWNQSETVAYSMNMGWVDLSSYPIIYQYELGWFQVMAAPASMGNDLWMHSPTIGWVYTQKNWEGDFYKLSGGWTLDNFHNPNP